MCFQIHKAIYPVYRFKDPQNHKCFQDVVDDASKTIFRSPTFLYISGGCYHIPLFIFGNAIIPKIA